MFGSGNSGVLWDYESSLSIISSAFTNNSAIMSGGVMYASRSSFSSTFTSNSAAGYSNVDGYGFGGVINTYIALPSLLRITRLPTTVLSMVEFFYTIESSFSITDGTFDNNS